MGIDNLSFKVALSVFSHEELEKLILYFGYHNKFLGLGMIGQDKKHITKFTDPLKSQALSILENYVRWFIENNNAEFNGDKMSIQEFLVEILGASVRCVDEVWREDPRPVRDGTKMVMIPEVIFNCLEKALISAMKENMGGFTVKYNEETDSFYYARKS